MFFVAIEYILLQNVAFKYQQLLSNNCYIFCIESFLNYITFGKFLSK